MVPRLAILLLSSLSLAAGAQDVEQPPPFITTPDEVVERMLRLAGTGPEDYVIDLGSGDGRIVIAAASKFGARGHGIELDGALVERSRENARRAGVAERAAFVQGDVLISDISRATVVTIYLLPSLIHRLQPRLLAELRPGTRVVSHAFPMLSWKPDRSETMRISKPHQGQGDMSAMFLWIVPAEARGDWRAQGVAGEWRLRIHQNYQEIEVEGTFAGRPVKFEEVRLSGARISWRANGRPFAGRVERGRIAGTLESDRDAVPLEFRRGR